jgi:hypothetical protein
LDQISGHIVDDNMASFAARERVAVTAVADATRPAFSSASGEARELRGRAGWQLWRSSFEPR